MPVITYRGCITGKMRGRKCDITAKGCIKTRSCLKRENTGIRFNEAARNSAVRQTIDKQQQQQQQQLRCHVPCLFTVGFGAVDKTSCGLELSRHNGVSRGQEGKRPNITELVFRFRFAFCEPKNRPKKLGFGSRKPPKNDRKKWLSAFGSQSWR